jgi:hypothetical protein
MITDKHRQNIREALEGDVNGEDSRGTHFMMGYLGQAMLSTMEMLQQMADEGKLDPMDWRFRHIQHIVGDAGGQMQAYNEATDRSSGGVQIVPSSNGDGSKSG